MQRTTAMGNIATCFKQPATTHKTEHATLEPLCARHVVRYAGANRRCRNLADRTSSAVRCLLHAVSVARGVRCAPARRSSSAACCLAVVSGARCHSPLRSAQLYDLTADGAEQSPISDATALATLEALPDNAQPASGQRAACDTCDDRCNEQRGACNMDGTACNMAAAPMG